MVIDLPYGSISGAIKYIYFGFILGNYDVDPFYLGSASQVTALHLLFIVCSFSLGIHLLNMLIAIMGNTFAERSLYAEEIKLKDHLNFVMTNWHLKK
jgi:hypothetical protein